jgi:Toxin SymE, type I toxin-antitoxin system
MRSLPDRISPAPGSEITDSAASHPATASPAPPAAPAAAHRALTEEQRSFLAEAACNGGTILQRKDACEYSLARPEERPIAAALVEQLLALGLLRPRDYSESHHQLAVTDLGRAVFALPARLKRTGKAAPPPRPTRRLKVAYQSQGDLLVPTIRVAGLWLEALGFWTGRRVLLEASAGRLVITVHDDAEP